MFWKLDDLYSTVLRVSADFNKLNLRPLGMQFEFLFNLQTVKNGMKAMKENPRITCKVNKCIHSHSKEHY